MLADSGGYTVHPVPTPLSIIAEKTSRTKDGGRSHSLRLFIRGKAISGAPSIRGSSQFPNPPIIIGMTMKKIIKNAWAVTIVLYSWSLPKNDPGWPSSSRMRILMEVPSRPPQVPRMK